VIAVTAIAIGCSFSSIVRTDIPSTQSMRR
jgi:hypothetical protein